jgi:cytochrome P450
MSARKWAATSSAVRVLPVSVIGSLVCTVDQWFVAAELDGWRPATSGVVPARYGDDVAAPARPDSIPGLDIVSHDVYERGVPYAAYDRFRAEAPVAWVNEGPHNGHHGVGFWSLTRWADVVDGAQGLAHLLERDRRHRDRGARTRRDRGPADDARDRSAATHAPAPAREPGLREADHRAVRGRADRLVDELLGRRRRRRGGRRRPPRSHASCRSGCWSTSLGVPVDDAPQLFHWTDQIVYNADPDYVDELADVSDSDRHRSVPAAPVPQPGVAQGLRAHRAARRSAPAPTPPPIC